MRRIAIAITACLALAVFTGCRCQVIVAFGGPADGTLTAPKDYDDVLNGNKPSVDIAGIPLIN